MNARDELAVALAAAYGESPSSADDDAADAIVAAGWVKPRTITTVAELEKLVTDLDEARATGVVYTYGMIQQRIRAIIAHA